MFFWNFDFFLDIYLDSDFVRTKLIIRNTIKQNPFGIYVIFDSVRIVFYQIGSDFWICFICQPLLWSVYMFSNLSKQSILYKWEYIIDMHACTYSYRYGWIERFIRSTVVSSSFLLWHFWKLEDILWNLWANVEWKQNLCLLYFSCAKYWVM